MRFPDALNGTCREACRRVESRGKGKVMKPMCFVIQMRDVRYFTPNTDTHPAFAKALREAAGDGVRVVAYDCEVKP